MAWWIAPIYDRFMRTVEQAGLQRWRAQLLDGVAGDVLEIGAGSGANLPFYGAAIRRLVLAEPDDGMRARLKRKPHDGHHVEIVDWPAERIGAAEESFDVVVATLVLCSVDSVERALSEIHRVLRPGGRFVFLEHVAADENPRRLTWQRRIEPLWKPLAGNCHLTRHTEADIRAAHFVIDDITRESMRKAMALVRPTIRGVAHKARPIT